MSDWAEYKEKVRNTNPEIGRDIDEVEKVSAYSQKMKLMVDKGELRLAINRAIDSIEGEWIDKTEASEWIPTSERLPNCNGCYLVWRPHFFNGEIGMPAICYFDGQNTWHDSYGVDFERVLSSDDVVAWMPLPEPYKRY